MKNFTRKSLRVSVIASVLALSALAPTFAVASTDPEPPPPTTSAVSFMTTLQVVLSAISLF